MPLELLLEPLALGSGPSGAPNVPGFRCFPLVIASRYADVSARQSLDSLEFQQLGLWHATLDSLRSYDAVCPQLSYSDALGLLFDLSERQVSQPTLQSA